MKWRASRFEERVDPDGDDGAVLDGEDRALFVVRGLRIEELRVPVLAGPAALAFGTEERRGLVVGQVYDEIECGLGAEELWRRRGGLGGRGGAECCCSGQAGYSRSGDCGFHRLRSLR